MKIEELTMKQAKKELKLAKGRLSFMDNKEDRAKTLSDIEQLETYVKERKDSRRAKLIAISCVVGGIAVNIGAKIVGEKLINR